MEKLVNQTLQNLEIDHFPWKKCAIKHTLGEVFSIIQVKETKRNVMLETQTTEGYDVQERHKWWRK